eukprot:m.143992 g.143992  ORF g.143992 m.143992 type:complete len:64 (+) comp38398_c1_seq2:881-1072(+)
MITMRLLIFCIGFIISSSLESQPNGRQQKSTSCSGSGSSGIPGIPGHNGLPGRDEREGQKESQ